MGLSVAILTVDKRENDRDYDDPVPKFGTAPEALLQGFARLDGIEVHVVSCTQKPMNAPEKLAHNIWFHSLHVPKRGWLRTGYQGCIRATRAKLKEIKPDVVHGQGTERDCALSAVFSGFPNVVTIHGNMRMIAKLFGAKPFSYQWLAAKIEPFTIARTGGVVCITEYTRSQVSDLSKRTWVVPNAVDQNFFAIAPAPVAPPLILCVGSIDARKNQNTLIDALAPLAAKMPIRLLFLGGINAASPYGREFLDRLKANPWCEHAGFADRDLLRTYFAQASLVALPSIEDNCPMVVLEAMAAGVPVVAGRVGGVPELIEHRQTGLLFDPCNPEEIKMAIAEILSNPATGEGMAKAAKSQANRVFHPEAVATRHLEIYREFLVSSR